MAMVRMSLPTRLAYGFGSVAYGVNNNGLDYFLLIFYSQVLGVDAPLVGLALLLALVQATSMDVRGGTAGRSRLFHALGPTRGAVWK
jgi:Na+/melibiose symporter-like transporter